MGIYRYDKINLATNSAGGVPVGIPSERKATGKDIGKGISHCPVGYPTVFPVYRAAGEDNSKGVSHIPVYWESIWAPYWEYQWEPWLGTTAKPMNKNEHEWARMKD